MVEGAAVEVEDEVVDDDAAVVVGVAVLVGGAAPCSPPQPQRRTIPASTGYKILATLQASPPGAGDR